LTDIFVIEVWTKGVHSKIRPKFTNKHLLQIKNGNRYSILCIAEDFVRKEGFVSEFFVVAQ